MYANRFIGFSLFGSGFSAPYKAAPFSHLLPDTNISVSENLFIVSRHLFEQPLHLRTVLSTLMFSSCFKFKNSVLCCGVYFSLLIKAAPNAPIIPEISGLITSLPINFSKLLKTKSL